MNFVDTTTEQILILEVCDANGVDVTATVADEAHDNVSFDVTVIPDEDGKTNLRSHDIGHMLYGIDLDDFLMNVDDIAKAKGYTIKRKTIRDVDAYNNYRVWETDTLVFVGSIREVRTFMQDIFNDANRNDESVYYKYHIEDCFGNDVNDVCAIWSTATVDAFINPLDDDGEEDEENRVWEVCEDYHTFYVTDKMYRMYSQEYCRAIEARQYDCNEDAEKEAFTRAEKWWTENGFKLISSDSFEHTSILEKNGRKYKLTIIEQGDTSGGCFVTIGG